MSSEEPTRVLLPTLEEREEKSYSLVTQALFVLFTINAIWALVVVGVVWMLH